MLQVEESDIAKLVAALEDLLQGRLVAEISLPSLCSQTEFARLVSNLNRLIAEQRLYSEFAWALSRGELSRDLPRHTMHHALKALQASLRHLVWQTQQIAQGNLVQEIDFMGELSSSFNSMIEALRHGAMHDQLTGLPNQKLLADRLLHALAVAEREGFTLALFYLDLDDFRLINDSLGHSVGDILLQEVGARLRKRVREPDTVARLGGR
jgi:predicted signal transduction protein with EAL and GGDEF domain